MVFEHKCVLAVCGLVMRGSSHNPRTPRVTRGAGWGGSRNCHFICGAGWGGSLKKKKKIHVCCVQFPIANIKYLGISIFIFY